MTFKEKIKPEAKVEIRLWDWLSTHSSNLKAIYFNRKNGVSEKVFTTQGENKKPDFLIEFLNQWSNQLEFIAVEVKVGNKGKDLFDANKIIEYNSNYVSGKTRYFINNQEIKINHFVVASGCSPIGKLFVSDSEIVDVKLDVDNWAQNYTGTLCPYFEYRRTKDYLRGLWAWFKKNRNKGYPSLGLLLSDNINKPKLSEGNIGNPILFIMEYDSIKGRWRQGVRLI